MMGRGQYILVSLCVVGMLGGCAGRAGSGAPAPAVATDVPTEQAQAAYWMARPASASVAAQDYDQLYQACEWVMRERRFVVDREDFRSGLITSRPLISKQFWETWRSDVGSGEQLTASSLATYRRTVRWQIEERDGRYVATPFVVVERFSDQPRRVTAAVQYRAALSGAEAQTRLESPRLAQVPTSRWYATGRDEALEGKLVEDVEARLRKR